MTMPSYTGHRARTYEDRRRGQPEWAAEHEAVRQVLNGLRPGDTVLDVPVGTGRFLPLYEEHGLGVIGIDVSEDMLSEARKKGTGADLRIGDIRNLGGVRAGLSVCMRLANWLDSDDLRAALSELARVSDAVLLGAQVSKKSGVVVGGATAHEIEFFLEAVRGAGLSIGSTETISDGSSYQYCIFRLSVSVNCIELFGPPGVGKTTAAQACGSRIVRPLLGDLPGPYERLVGRAREVHVGPLERFLDDTLLYIRRAAALSGRGKSPVIVDEMLAQRAALLAVHGSERAAERFIEAIPDDHALYVRLVAPTGVVVNRGEQRNRRGVDANMAARYESACDFVSERLRCRIIDASLPLEALVGGIAMIRDGLR